MRSWVTLLALLASGHAVHAHGLLIPTEKSVPPLAMLRHEVAIAVLDQAAETKVEQTFRNHTDRDLEATYVFPVPRGAGVTRFSMLIDGKSMAGELVDATRARAVYAEAVRRSRNPGLLEYVGNNVFQLQVFPVPAKKDVKVSLCYTAELARDAGVIEYVYPLKTDGRATGTLDKFAIAATLKSQHGIQNIYSPTHAVGVRRTNNREAEVIFQQQQALLDKDFRLLFTLGEKDVGLTALTHRPAGAAKGHVMLLLSPRAEQPKTPLPPRDVVLVLDVSGSMMGASIQQAKGALKFVLDRLGDQDRFGLITFSDRVNKFGGGLHHASTDNVALAKQWVDSLEAVGGTNINEALLTGLDLRPDDPRRNFTVIFFTDGQPTVGETKPEKIVANVLVKNTANTRLFTFGVGNDVNATLLDQLALRTRAASVYVRPGEDIESKVSSLYQKISQPVLVNLRLNFGAGVIADEMYPPKLPDLFHGGQMTVLARYLGHGKVKVTLHGTLGKDEKTFEYEVNFPERTGGGRELVEVIWARRKIGFLLDQIRAHGEQKELVDAVVTLAKAHGIATPYTSYLIVPDAPMPVVGFGQPAVSSAAPAPNRAPKASGAPAGQANRNFLQEPPRNFRGFLPPSQPLTPLDNTGGGFQGAGNNQGVGWQGGFGFQGAGNNQGNAQGGLGFQGGQISGSLGGGGFGGGIGAPSQFPSHPGGGIIGNQGNFQGGFGFQGGQGNNQGGRVVDWARTVQGKQGALADSRGQLADGNLGLVGNAAAANALQTAKQARNAYDQAQAALAKRQHAQTQAGKLGVDLSVQSSALRDQTRLALTPLRKIAGRTVLEIGGVWIDEGYTPATPTFTIQALSPAYFRLLERRPQLRELFQLGNHLVWITPSGFALVIDLDNGHETLGDVMLDNLFEPRKKM